MIKKCTLLKGTSAELIDHFRNDVGVKSREDEYSNFRDVHIYTIEEQIEIINKGYGLVFYMTPGILNEKENQIQVEIAMQDVLIQS